MDTVAWISIIVGVVLSFNGVMLTVVGAANKRWLTQIEDRVQNHEGRIVKLEVSTAVVNTNITAILEALGRIEATIERHEDVHHSNGGSK